MLSSRSRTSWSHLCRAWDCLAFLFFLYPQEVAFDLAVRHNVHEERQNQLRWQVKIGDDPLLTQHRYRILEDRWTAIAQYKVGDGMWFSSKAVAFLVISLCDLSFFAACVAMLWWYWSIGFQVTGVNSGGCWRPEQYVRSEFLVWFLYYGNYDKSNVFNQVDGTHETEIKITMKNWDRVRASYGLPALTMCYHTSTVMSDTRRLYGWYRDRFCKSGNWKLLILKLS